MSIKTLSLYCCDKCGKEMKETGEGIVFTGDIYSNPKLGETIKMVLPPASSKTDEKRAYCFACLFEMIRCDAMENYKRIIDESYNQR